MKLTKALVAIALLFYWSFVIILVIKSRLG